MVSAVIVRGHLAVAVLDVLQERKPVEVSSEVQDVVHAVAIVVSTGVLYRLAVLNVTRVGELRCDGVEDHDVLRGVCGVRVAAVVGHNGLPRTRHHVAAFNRRRRRLHSHLRWSQCAAAAELPSPCGKYWIQQSWPFTMPSVVSWATRTLPSAPAYSKCLGSCRSGCTRAPPNVAVDAPSHLTGLECNRPLHPRQPRSLLDGRCPQTDRHPAVVLQLSETAPELTRTGFVPNAAKCAPRGLILVEAGCRAQLCAELPLSAHGAQEVTCRLATPHRRGTSSFLPEVTAGVLSIGNPRQRHPTVPNEAHRSLDA